MTISRKPRRFTGAHPNVEKIGKRVRILKAVKQAIKDGEAMPKNQLDIILEKNISLKKPNRIKKVSQRFRKF